MFGPKGLGDMGHLWY